MAKRWSKDEISYMKRYAAKRRVNALADRFGVDAGAVREKLDELGLEASDHRPASSDPDPGIAGIERGIKALYQKKYAEAEKHLVQAEAAAGQSEVANMARRYLAAARERLVERKEPDPYLQAVYERNRGNVDAALDICSRGGRQGKDERFAHLAASIYAAQGEVAKAAKLLEVAIQLNPRNRVLAYHDADFAELRNDPAYAGMFDLAD